MQARVVQIQVIVIVTLDFIQKPYLIKLFLAKQFCD